MYGIFNRFNSNLAKGDVSKVENSFNCKSRKEAIKSKRTTIEYRSSRKAENICHKIIKHSDDGQLVENLKSLVDKIGLDDVCSN